MGGFVSKARTAHYIVVHPSVVRDLKSAASALLYIRMAWRCEEVTPHTVKLDGHIWWQVEHKQMVVETGLSIDQVRYALTLLVKAGHVEERSRGKGRSMLYRPTRHEVSEYPDALDEVSEYPEGVSGASEGGVSEGSNSLLSIELEASGGENLNTGLSGPELFEDAWKAWPRKESKRKAKEAFLRLKNQVEVAAAIKVQGEAYALHRGAKFTPYLITWINRPGWEDPTPGPEVTTSRGEQRAMSTMATVQKYRTQQEGERHALEG